MKCILIRKSGKWKSGKYVELPPERITLEVVILPIDARLLQLEGGRYTMDDRAIYSLIPLNNGDQIERDGGIFTIDKTVDYSEYADFKKYLAKRVTTHG
ncbi:hypothetical protein E0485_15170 [Paenibacillus albiflavus]|uniref:Uncharacterized protein n=1 Tax=Paenibacillus albiflavus TaxID=2545760 RepID=A0A4R4EDU6_9BACL|nr:hypothetical protein E0485_15170 [Paenibacillus albiflavus]